MKAKILNRKAFEDWFLMKYVQIFLCADEKLLLNKFLEKYEYITRAKIARIEAMLV